MAYEFDKAFTFYKNLTDKNFLLKLIRNYYSYENDYQHSNIDFESKSVFLVDLDEYGNSVEINKKLEDVLAPIVKLNNDIIKDVIKVEIIHNTVNATIYTNYVFNIIQDFIDKNSLLFNDYPFINYPLEALVKLLNSFLSPNQVEYALKIKWNIIPINKQDKLENLTLEIFGFMKGNNHLNEKILNDDDYNYFIKVFQEYIKDDILPNKDRQILTKLEKGTLFLIFWVFNKEYSSSTKKKDSLSIFISNLFEDFKETTKESIAKQFGTRSRWKSYDFLPQIVKKHVPKNDL